MEQDRAFFVIVRALESIVTSLCPVLPHICLTPGRAANDRDRRSLLNFMALPLLHLCFLLSHGRCVLKYKIQSSSSNPLIIRTDTMAELVAIGFDNPHEADRVLTELTRLQREYLIDLEDAVVAIRQPDGKVSLKQSINLVGVGAASGGLSGALWGSLVGLLFLSPLAGMTLGGLVGAGSGALSGSLIDYGIDDNFIRQVAETLQPNTSALFVLVRKAQPEKVLSELSQVRGRVLRSSLAPEQEARLQAAHSGVAATPELVQNSASPS